jgi:hypothetical protein
VRDRFLAVYGALVLVGGKDVDTGRTYIISASAGCAGAVKARPASGAAHIGGHRPATTKSSSAADHDVLSLRVGNVNWKTAPCGTLLDAHNRPPCASMIARQIDRPTPTPSGFVV